MIDHVAIDGAQIPLRFGGPAYSAAKDEVALTGQAEDIFALMRDGAWRTLAEIEHNTGHPQASISAQLRHLKKGRFGAHAVEKRRRVTDGVEQRAWEYRLTVNEKVQMILSGASQPTEPGQQ